MAGHQFLHVETYAREVSALKGQGRAKKGEKRKAKTSDTGWSARQIIAEVRREDGEYSPSIIRQDPELLMGDIDGLAIELDELALNPPKGTRKDAPILMAGVMSAPWPPTDPRSIEWRMDCTNYLVEKFGGNLRAVVAHNDESYDHLHFYVCMPSLSPVRSLHPGLVARKQAADEGLSGSDQKQAYSAAMRVWQDEYYNQIGMRHAQTRIGPGRERLGRMEWMERKAQAELIAEVLQATELDRASAAAAVDLARKDADLVINSARATSMVVKGAAAAELKEAQKQRKELADLKEETTRLRDDLVTERQVFKEEVAQFKKVLKSIYDRLPALDRVALVPFLSAFDQAKAAVLAVCDRFAGSKKTVDTSP